MRRFTLCGWTGCRGAWLISTWFLAACLTLPAHRNFAAGLTYVDADEGANGMTNLSPLSAIHTTNAADDGLWGYRALGTTPAGGIFQSVLEAGGGGDGEDVPEITQTISGLTAETDYDIYVAYWQGGSGAHNWNVRSGLASGDLTLFNAQGPDETFPDAVAGTHSGFFMWDAPPLDEDGNPMFTESPRTLLLGRVGTATSNVTGQLDVFIDDLSTLEFGSPNSNRTWLDGVAYVEAGTEVFIQPGDLDVSGIVDEVDAGIFLENLHTDVSSLTIPETYLLGDMDGDLVIGHADFAAFKAVFNAANGAGAFERLAAAVPEPSAMLILLIVATYLFLAAARTTRKQPAPAYCRTGNTAPRTMVRGACLACFLLPGAVHADPVTGWAVDTSVGSMDASRLTAGSDTDSPVLGDGTSESAAGVAIYADIAGAEDAAPDVSLSGGQQVIFSGSATFTGMESASNGFRFGLFNESGPMVDAFGWLGYIGNNSSGGGGGSMNSRDSSGTDFDTVSFISTTSGRAVNLQSAQDGGPFVDGTYDFSLAVARFDEEVVINASMTSEAGWSQVWNTAIESDPTRVTFDFNRVGFLASIPLAPDQINFSGIDVSTGPVEALKLQVTTDGDDAGTMQIVNNLGASFDIDYYEITSEAGSLNPTGWTSLDSQESGDPVTEGWDEAAASNEQFLSEVNFQSTAAVTSESSSWLNLGQAFSAGDTEDLQFFYGLPNGALARGVVEYVTEGAVPGDYTGDGLVTAADYVAWRDALGQNVTMSAGADGNGNGTVDQPDYEIWKQNFGGTAAAAASSTAVPEPYSLLVWLLATFGCLRRGRAESEF